MSLRPAIAMCLLPAAILTTGCSGSWRPSLEAVVPPEQRHTFDLRPYLAGDADRPMIYERKSLSDPDDPPSLFRRRPQATALTLGSLADRPVHAVADYLEPTDRARRRRGALWPEDPENRGVAFFLEFDPPLTQIPGTIAQVEGHHQRSRLLFYNRHAELIREGTVMRSVVFEGLESVEVGDVVYPACARLRAVTKFRLPWWPRVDVTEYLWLAPGVGEVRRIERISGLAWLAYFEDVQQYELVEPRPIASRPASPTPDEPPAWSRCAVFLDRLPPHPRLGGAVIDLARPSSSEAVALSPASLQP
ncbi:MAG: hypothetical protein IID40_10075 [Planctomycetes bacterium]|nr:hypothetical protein [Planctomycetota bacterium]